MKCNQCNNNAIGAVGPEKIPLCLNCWSILQNTLERQNNVLREEMNFLSDSIDSMFGIRTGARYPIKRPVLVAGGNTTHNHISISGGQIGVLNTGNIQSLNQTISNLYTASATDLANNIRDFSRAIIKDEKLNDGQKSEVIEGLDFVAKELFKKPENRKLSILKILIGKISDVTQFTANALTIWQILQPLLEKYLALK